MLTFVVRRIIASILVLLAASYLMYLLIAFSGNPLEDLLESSAPNKQQLIESRTQMLNLDTPAPLRYFGWLAGASKCLVSWVPGVTAQCDLGVNNKGIQVTELLQGSIGSTLQLLTASVVLAVFIGIAVGITTALRQYSGYDYSVTFLAFLFFSLPTFWLAVLLKQFVAIGFNDFLRDPHISLPVVVALALLSGAIWTIIIGGPRGRKLIVFSTATISTVLVLVYISATNFLQKPSLGPVIIASTGVGISFLVTAISVGLARRATLYACLSTVAIGIAVYYPIQSVFKSATVVLMLSLGALTIVISGLIGYWADKFDRWQAARTSAITGFLVAGLVALDRLMRAWPAYINNSAIAGRPIATIGVNTPQLHTSSFWVTGVDKFTHLLLPTIALMLISVASYSRYTRSSFLEVMNQDYIRTARAKGLTERAVVMRHAFRNALIPITTIVAFDIGALIGGAVITERVFGWTGMGSLFASALGPPPDPNPLMGFFIVTGIVAVAFNAIADVLYAALDPRIRVST
ncbi:MAG: ABC transporter permease subunit [Mycobacteriaceae bacterium]